MRTNPLLSDYLALEHLEGVAAPIAIDVLDNSIGGLSERVGHRRVIEVLKDLLMPLLDGITDREEILQVLQDCREIFSSD